METTPAFATAVALGRQNRLGCFENLSSSSVLAPCGSGDGALPLRTRRAGSRARAPTMGIFDTLKSKVLGTDETEQKTSTGTPSRPQTLQEDPALSKYTERVARINALESEIEGKSNEELQSRFAEIRSSLADGSATQDNVLEEVFALVREASYRVLGIRHYDVQLVGGMVLNDGSIAEMATGEGKTYVAALPSALNAADGSPVFVITVNDYLAKRDAELIGQIHRFLGLKVGLIQAGMTPQERREAYSCDIVYVTNSELGFDYLRDNLAVQESEVVILRPFGFCIVDEADSILIDEARTPLIISAKSPAPQAKYATAAKAAAQLENELHYTVNEKEQSVLLTEIGYTVMEEALNVKDLFDVQNPWAQYITNALKAKEIFQRDVNYIVRDEQQDIQIVDEFTGRVMEGRRWSDGLHQAVEAKEGLTVDSESKTVASISYQAFFKLFPKLAGMTGTASTEAGELDEIYGLRVLPIPTALPNARKDYDDVVFRNAEGKYKAIMREIARVAPTGRPILIGTTSIEASEALSQLLTEVEVPHEVLNAKPETALRESEIIAQAGRMYSITLATNMAGRGTDILLGGNALYFARALARKELVSLDQELYDALMADDETCVLIDDEELPCELSEETFEALNVAAKAVAEACKPKTLLEIDELVALAAEYGPIPEGLDGLGELRGALELIKDQLSDVVEQEKEAVIKAGGLYVIGTERAESRRVDNQLRGRAGRQGDPGGSRFFLALDDRLFRVFGGEKVTGLLDTFRVDAETPIENRAVTSALDSAQTSVETYYAEIRRSLFAYDEVLSTQRGALYAQRRATLLDTDDSVLDRILNDSLETGREIMRGYVNKESGDDDLDGLAGKIVQFFPDIARCSADDLKGLADGVSVEEHVEECIQATWLDKKDKLDGRRAGLAGGTARYLYLVQVDNLWQAHMKEMDYLKEFVGLRSYGQDDPLQVYQTEGFELFQAMLAGVRRNSVYSFYQYNPNQK